MIIIVFWTAAFCENRVCSVVVWLGRMYLAKNDCCFQWGNIQNAL